LAERPVLVSKAPIKILEEQINYLIYFIDKVRIALVTA